MTTAIEIDGISKRYLLGGQNQQYVTIRERMLDVVRAPFRRSPKIDESEKYLWALRDISLSIEQGSVFGLIGPNGSGKSTLLKILSRITTPTNGSARLRGRVGSLLEVGTGFHPELSGRDNIYLSGAVLGMRRAEVRSKFDEIVAFAEIERFLDTPVKHYSSGMYVRLGFAVAAHLDPEILLIDEVLAVGDLAFQKKCLEKMERVAQGGRSIIFVSHNIAAVQRICTSGVLLRSGRTAAIGPVKEVVDTYLGSIYGSTDEAARSSVVFESASAPGDASIRLSRVDLFSPSGAPSASFRIDEGFEIHTEFEILEELSNFHLYLKVYREDGVLVFCTADWDGGEVEPNSLCVGAHHASVAVPPHTLNAGAFYVDVQGYIPSIRQVFHTPNAVRWTVLAQGGTGGVESVARQGVVRPSLRWQLEQD